MDQIGENGVGIQTFLTTTASGLLCELRETKLRETSLAKHDFSRLRVALPTVTGPSLVRLAG